MPRDKLVLDYETRSHADLRKVGGVTYAEHPSTEIICVGYKLNDQKTKLWLPWRDAAPSEFIDAMNDAGPEGRLAHNAFFEQSITKWVLPRYTDKIISLPPRFWKCSAAKAAACALPRDLEGAGAALRLPIQKNMRGRKLMLKHSKPRPAWVRSGNGAVYFEDEYEREEIYAYCKTDVDAEKLLDNRLPDLTPDEQALWVLNQEMNFRGVRIDIPSVKIIMAWIKQETKRLNAELMAITDGEVESVNKRDPFMNWIRKYNITMPNLQRDTVTKVIEMLEGQRTGSYPAVIEALKIRQQIGRAALKKYPAMLKRASSDGRVKDYSMYHGASTGREAGRGLQLQNLVKGKIKDTDLAIKMINTSTLDEMRFLYGDVFEVFSSSIRGMIQASSGCDLYAADYNAIEARVLQWMAGDEAGLKRFRENVDSYVLMAEKIFGGQVDKATPDGKEKREVGKRAELGCGFGMGGDKFYATCIQFGAKNVTKELAKRAVLIFRETHPEIPAMWSGLEKAAIRAVKRPGWVVKINKTAWEMRDGFLWCQLPSGRKLAFYEPTVRMEPTPWGEETPRLYHWSVNPKTKKWENASTYGGKLTENVVQATARDIMTHAMMALRKHNFKPLFAVHDELIAEAFTGNLGRIDLANRLAQYEKILMTLPKWADGLPITAKGWRGPRYKKA